MTYEKALEILRDTAIDIRSAREDDIHTLYAKAHLIAMDCIEKRIPKKPIDDYRYKPKICPFCHTFLENYQSFCDNCGQKIDWSEEE